MADLIRIFGVASDPAEVEADLSLVDYLEGRKKFWEERKSLAPLERELEEVKRERDALKQELENAKKEFETVEKQRGIKAEFPIGSLKLGKWHVAAPKGKYYTIADPRNAYSATVTNASYNNFAEITVKDAAIKGTWFNGLSIGASIDICRLNETQAIYFYYKEV